MPAKRKAKDIATPTRPPASRARSARTSKAAPATDGNDSESPPPRPVKKPRGAASRAAKQNGGEDDDFGDYGRWVHHLSAILLRLPLTHIKRGSSKPATIEQHLMDQNKKSKAFIQSFKEQVAQGREQAEEALARLKQDLSVSPLPTSFPRKPITNQPPTTQHQTPHPRQRHRHPLRHLHHPAYRSRRATPLHKGQPPLLADPAPPAP